MTGTTVAPGETIAENDDVECVEDAWPLALPPENVGLVNVVASLLGESESTCERCVTRETRMLRVLNTSTTTLALYSRHFHPSSG